MIRGPLLALLFTLPLALARADEAAADPAKNPPAPAARPAAARAPDADSPGRLRELVDTLDQAALQEAFRLLTKEYIQEGDLDPLEVNRAALQGMLTRLDFGAMLLTERTRAERDSPYGFHHERIHDAIGYVRFGRFREEELAKFDAALSGFQAEKEITHLVVDLRSPQAQAEFSFAARLLSRFRPPNELLFKIRRPGNERPALFVSSPEAASCRLVPILLVDRETGNVGEIIAAVLKRETGCLVIGEPTPGLAVEYRDVPLGEDRILRYAIAEVVLEDDSSIFRTGIVPDLQTPTSAKAKSDLFKAVDGGRALVEFLYRKPRPRMNEAALVSRTDPEIDYYLLLSQNKPTPWDEPAMQDRMLQQAVDLVDTTRFLESGAKGRR
jgi:hypothetical protein